MDCGVIILWLPAELEDVQSADISERGVEIRWVGFSSVITVFFVFSFIFEVHSYNKVGELFMGTLRGHEYGYDFFFLFAH